MEVRSSTLRGTTLRRETFRAPENFNFWEERRHKSPVYLTEWYKPCDLVAERDGGLAQLARAPALQAGGQRFESVILHGPTPNV